MTSHPIRVLIVDDSALVRCVLSRGLGSARDLEVVGTAGDPYQARDLIVKLRPDVVTLDVEMPRMDGLTFLRKLMGVLPTPVIVLSSLAGRGSAVALDALDAGAVDVVEKPAAGVEGGLERAMSELVARIRVAARATVQLRPAAAPIEEPPPRALAETTDQVLGLGASTGGVAALGRILPAFPASSPGMVIVQHMPPGFTADFAERLDGLCRVRVREAQDGDRVLRGHVLVAPGGDRHLEVQRYGGEYRVVLRPGERVSGHRPSVDVFLRSLAEHVGRNAAACLMTGMGSDGATGLLELRQAGGRTLIQDRASCAVWGMPAAAEALGAAERAVSLTDIPAALLDIVARRPRAA